MTLLYSHDVRWHGSAGASRFTLRRVVKRISAAFRLIHSAIAAAKIHRLRNELLLHRDHEDWTQLNVRSALHGEDVTRYPHQPVVLGEKWDY
ncbi:hypothetical protein JQ615_07505 [Bradyrhizobium jicamae]|uniref:Uncharacterized protein n=1 Tax=Bradyrhizobium jicamae TaxID=280332 RepID=A0ABS5FEK9_9BRAD|nr:hypothetical protein [Bradyrhizobium jicamae]MBR0795229.1 hypothetical protein [Bradyrhizobium jicamae]